MALSVGLLSEQYLDMTLREIIMVVNIRKIKAKKESTLGYSIMRLQTTLIINQLISLSPNLKTRRYLEPHQLFNLPGENTEGDDEPMTEKRRRQLLNHYKDRDSKQYKQLN